MDRTSNLTLSQVKMVMDLLCSIAFDPVNLDSRRELQDNLDMMVRKQILSSVSA